MKTRYFVAICAVFVLAVVFRTIFTRGRAEAVPAGETPSGGADLLEIYHFHRTNQCYSCITLGQYAEETVNTYFRNELDSGKIVFGHINGELAKNRELTMKYGATGSSLWLGTYKDGKFTAEENVNVWYKIGDKQQFIAYLKGLIEEKLGEK